MGKEAQRRMTATDIGGFIPSHNNLMSEITSRRSNYCPLPIIAHFSYYGPLPIVAYFPYYGPLPVL
jgi:hypothetical protein